MMKKPTLLDRIKGRKAGTLKAWEERPFWTLEDFRSPFLGALGADRERIENNFAGYVQGAYKKNGAVFACMAARQMVFCEARFLWTRFTDGRRGDLFFAKELEILETPWPGGTTGDLLAHMIQDADLAGNAFLTLADDDGNYGSAAKGPTRRVVRMRPDQVEMLLGSHSGDLQALDTKIIAFVYKPAGGHQEVTLLPSEVAHFSPVPDPVARFRGMSWLTPVLREIESDSSATLHKKNFFDHAAVPNIAVKFDRDTSEEDFDEFVQKFKENHQGAMNAYKTLFLMGGADVTPLTMDFKALDFANIVGKGESRIAAAAGVPASWVGFSESLQGSGLNSQGVYAAARRRFADGTMRPLWRQAAATLQQLLTPPAGARLWYDDRDIAFLREDSKDRAEIFKTEMATISQGIMAGFEPEAVIAAARDYDVTELANSHSGLVSVQMQSTRVPDPAADKAREDAELFEVQARAAAALAGSGRFTPESVAEAVAAGDISLLKEAEMPTVQPGLPGGQPQDKEPAQEPDNQKPGGAGDDRNSA
ncbi:phage portal protein [Streptomyces sp. NPDC012769]|uniref:phage portal protein n=1 Tax=Streptomyces sp. NPDC012769 TaxID=3364848 RepID=UPI0036B63102